MHMIWYNHKAGTGTGLIVQLSYKIMDNNLFGSVMIKTFVTSQ